MHSLIRRLILAAALMAGLPPVMAQAPPAVPGLPDTERRTSYSLSASKCACSVGFQIYGDSTDYQDWLEVFLNGVLVNYNDSTFGWTITSPTGPLATIPRPITDAVLTFNNAQTGTIQIVGARRPRRVTQFNENTGVPARNLNQALTDMVAMLREDWDKINDVTGRTALAPPGETLALLPSKTSRANQGACFDSNGNLTSCVSIPSSSLIAGSGISLTGSGPTTIAANLSAGPNVVLSGTSPVVIGVPLAAGGGISLTGSNPLTITATSGGWLVQSRATAATQDLHTFGVVKTGGYTTAGDGGGATFKNVGSTAFIDTMFGGGYGSFSIQAGGSSYTNGTFLGVPLGGGTGVNCAGQVVVSGGAVTSVTIIVPCVGYAANDVLSAPTLAGGSGFQLKVNSVTAPVGSFTDSIGTHFQYVVDDGNYINVKQFGAKVDWTCGYSGSTCGTDDTASIQAAWSFASYNADGHSPGNGGAAGAIVIHPRGTSLFCDNANSATSNTDLVLPQGVWAKGQGVLSAALHHCSAATAGAANVNPVTLCDTVSSVGQFGCRISDMTLYDPQTNGASSTAFIYSNSGQQQTLGDNLLILTASRGCVKYDTGRGGAANDIWRDMDCELTSASNTNAGFLLNSSGTQHHLTNVVFGCANFPCSTPAAINHLNGRLIADTLDIEGFPTGLNQNVSAAGNVSVFRNVQQNSNGCTQTVALNSTNTPGNILFENVATSCPTTILNGQSGGTSFTGNIVKPITCVSGACS